MLSYQRFCSEYGLRPSDGAPPIRVGRHDRLRPGLQPSGPARARPPVAAPTSRTASETRRHGSVAFPPQNGGKCRLDRRSSMHEVIDEPCTHRWNHPGNAVGVGLKPCANRTTELRVDQKRRFKAHSTASSSASTSSLSDETLVAPISTSSMSDPSACKAHTAWR